MVLRPAQAAHASAPDRAKAAGVPSLEDVARGVMGVEQARVNLSHPRLIQDFAHRRHGSRSPAPGIVGNYFRANFEIIRRQQDVKESCNELCLKLPTSENGIGGRGWFRPEAMPMGQPCWRGGVG